MMQESRLPPNLRGGASFSHFNPQSSLLANGLDFLVSAAEFASRDDERSWKYAVLHLWYGLELLLKARLEREHWSLLFSNIDHADRLKLISGDFLSVDSNQAYKRLKQICDIEIDPSDWKHLIALRNRSNRIRHHVAEYNSIQVKSMVWRCMNIGLAFCESQQMQEDSRTIQRQFYKVGSLLKGFDDFVNDRLKVISLHPDFDPDVKCMECWQTTCVIDANGILCQFCGVEIDAETLNQWMAEIELDASDSAEHQ